jgi:hypothetical protein
MRTRHIRSLPCRDSEGTISFKANARGNESIGSLVLRVYDPDLGELGDRGAGLHCLTLELESD